METILKTLESGMLGVAVRCAVNTEVHRQMTEMGGALQPGYQAGLDQGQGMQLAIPNDMPCARKAKFNQ